MKRSRVSRQFRKACSGWRGIDAKIVNATSTLRSASSNQRAPAGRVDLSRTWGHQPHVEFPVSGNPLESADAAKKSGNTAQLDGHNHKSALAGWVCSRAIGAKKRPRSTPAQRILEAA